MIKSRFTRSHVAVMKASLRKFAELAFILSWTQATTRVHRFASQSAGFPVRYRGVKLAFGNIFLPEIYNRRQKSTSEI
jgi:hypothetical protein